MTATEAEIDAALAYAWGALRDLANGNVPLEEAASRFAARNMDDLRKFYPQATEGLES